MVYIFKSKQSKLYDGFCLVVQVQIQCMHILGYPMDIICYSETMARMSGAIPTFASTASTKRL
jgi:hypothetical protein